MKIPQIAQRRLCKLARDLRCASAMPSRSTSKSKTPGMDVASRIANSYAAGRTTRYPYERSTSRARTSGYAAGAFLRPRRRLRHHAGDDLSLAQPDLGWPPAGPAVARRGVVGLVR